MEQKEKLGRGMAEKGIKEVNDWRGKDGKKEKVM